MASASVPAGVFASKESAINHARKQLRKDGVNSSEGAIFVTRSSEGV